MRVALLSHEGGGISSVCRGLANSLSKKQIETTIFSATVERTPKVEKINNYLEVIHLPLVDYPPRSLWFHFRNAGTILKSLGDYSLIHAVSPEMAVAYAFLRNHSGQPLVTTMHGSHRGYLKVFVKSPMSNWALGDLAYHLFEFPLHEVISRRCFARSNRVVVCSYTTLNELRMFEGFDVSKISVVYNGVSLSEVQREAEISNGVEDSGHELSVMYAGRLFWMKGITFVLRAFESLQDRFRNLQLKIFGKGPLENEIRRFIANRRLGNRVHFGGFLPHKELIKEIVKSDLVLFPSLYESQPMFALETMACKRPLIAFDVPYAREMIKNGHNGLLAKAYDVKDLTNKVASALQDKKLRQDIGKNAFAYVKANHNWDVQIERYLKVYKELAS